MKTKQFKIIGIKKLQYFIISAFLTFTSTTKIEAQEYRYSLPKWYFGISGATNFNFYRGSTQELNSEFTSPAAFHNGEGVGLYLAAAVEFHKPNSRWGFIFQTGIDKRSGKFNLITEPCNCPAVLTTKLSYFTIEPSIRFSPFKSSFYLFGGPRIALNNAKSFVFEQKTNPEYPLQIQNPDIIGDFNNIKNTVISGQFGLGFDIPLNQPNSKTQFLLSPFLSYHPYFGQNPRDIETWNSNTLRAGFVLKFGQGILKKMIVDGIVQFSIKPPINVAYVKYTKELFPIRNYIFFDLGSTIIPERYVQLKGSQVNDFKEDNVQFSSPQVNSGRSMRQLEVYYNILNILGDRMVKNSKTTIRLVGSNENGVVDGLTMALNVKKYLVTIFHVGQDRITTEGREKPLIPSELKGGTHELDLLKEGNRRVTIESDSPELMMEFQNGKDIPLKPIELMLETKIPEGDIVFNIDNSKGLLSSWTLQLKDEDGIILNYGPYKNEQVNISRNTILKDRLEGNYKVTMLGEKKAGGTITKESELHLVPFKAPEIQESTRYSVLYEYNEYISATLNENYLSEIVVPNIPLNATVIVTGHTDIIGDKKYNKALSLARANDVKSILEKRLASLGRNDVLFKVIGDGEDEKLALFENKYPEERFYNRTVVIDILK
jgi:outer membrane protein OmpA-like peptidoglycan-associated protein